MTITAAQVKALREETGAGMMDAKKALVKTEGNMDKAIDWLRGQSLIKASGKSGRAAKEGMIGLHVHGNTGVAVEISTETDFVARSSRFQDLIARISRIACESKTVETVHDLLATNAGNTTVAGLLNDSIAACGENMALRRIDRLSKPTNGNIVSYVHGAPDCHDDKPGCSMGQIGVLVAISGGNETLDKQIAMHIAASDPVALHAACLEPGLIEKERIIQTEIARQSGKPDSVVEKMIAGRINRFIAESNLYGQKFVLDQNRTVADVLKDSGAKVNGFVRMKVGESFNADPASKADLAEAVQDRPNP